ncbi:MAG TPA: DinB family protein [Dehalococcoidia bacterium]|nr:DinB family protein [Dehalococcoidia bacterium]
MAEKDAARAALARIEEAQQALRETLRDVTPARLNKRPPSGEWSPMEHVRHLIFAQQHHCGPASPEGLPVGQRRCPASRPHGRAPAESRGKRARHECR